MSHRDMDTRSIIRELRDRLERGVHYLELLEELGRPLLEEEELDQLRELVGLAITRSERRL